MARQLKSKIQLSTKMIELYGEVSACGAEGYFFEMGKAKYGIKAYYDFQTAIDSFNRQALAAKNGVGPKVRNFLVIKRKTKRPIFGYETEKAKQVTEDCPVWKKQSNNLRKKLVSLDMDGDFHPLNCGVIGDKLVAVDFGNLSYDCSVNRIS